MNKEINKEIIIVPKGVQFISQWKEYKFPEGECIVDKGVTGCGYTEFCLTNNKWVILCSPRRLLLENKSEQHKDDPNILYLKNEEFGKEAYGIFSQNIYNHINNCVNEYDLPVKFMVTYDSLHHVVKYLKELGILDEFYFVVDEFQSIFLDSYYKAEVELNFVIALKPCKNIIYLSATPLLDKYLKDLDYFKDLKYYKLDWDDTGYVEKVKVRKKLVKSLSFECIKIIKRYKERKFPMVYTKDHRVLYSTEAVFYFNSIGDIIKIIKSTKLSPEEVNVICANTEENRKKLRKIRHAIGRIPVKDEPIKMFTFCTSTAYIGVDFYSECASSFVFADPNIDSLALDISLDLPQIVGRQRNRNNLFKNEIIIFYRIKKPGEKELNQEEFDKKQEERKKETRVVLEIYKKIKDIEKKVYIKKLRSDIQVSIYSNDYVSISLETGKPVWNNLIEIASKRAWDVIQKDYIDQISVTKAFEDVEGILIEKEDYKSGYEEEAQSFLDNQFYKTNIFSEKMKLYCEFMDNYGGNSEMVDILDAKIDDPRFSQYYRFYGTQGCSAKKYRQSFLEKGMLDLINESPIEKEIRETFEIGEVYPKVEIKKTLQEIYDKFGISKTAKATDLEKYYRLKQTKLTLQNKKVVPSFRLA